MNAESKIEPAASLSAAMAKAFAEIEAATKGAENPAFKQGGRASKYANLTAIIDAIKPALINHGLFFTQHCHPSDDGVCVETVLGHESGEERSLGKLFVPANKKDAQGFGSALTYARRYALQTAFCVPTEDDDGNAASLSAPKADPAPVKMATDAQCATIMTLAPAAGKQIQDIVEAYKVSAIDELTEAKAAAVITRLQAAASVKEPA